MTSTSALAQPKSIEGLPHEIDLVLRVNAGDRAYDSEILARLIESSATLADIYVEAASRRAELLKSLENFPSQVYAHPEHTAPNLLGRLPRRHNADYLCGVILVPFTLDGEQLRIQTVSPEAYIDTTAEYLAAMHSLQEKVGLEFHHRLRHSALDIGTLLGADVMMEVEPLLYFKTGQQDISYVPCLEVAYFVPIEGNRTKVEFLFGTPIPKTPKSIQLMPS